MYRAAMAARARAYRLRLLPASEVPVPVISVGNLTVGGSGKTPISSWIARYYVERGLQPGIVLRGYGNDEGKVHRRLVEEAIVVENPDRCAGASSAVEGGADVLILDDAFQRLDIIRDLNIVLMSAESGFAVRWTLPAGPWREGWRALRRADFLVITRKRASEEAAERMASRVERIAPRRPVAIARLGVTAFQGLLSGGRMSTESIRGAQVLAVAGVADPHGFAEQCQAFGANVRAMPLDDHHEFSERDLGQMLQAAKRVDYVVVTEKDAVKLRPMWPDHAPEPLVACLDVAWEDGQRELETALDTVVARVDDLVS